MQTEIHDCFLWSSGDAIFGRGLQSGGRRLCRRKRLRMCGRTSSFCSKCEIFKSLKADKPRERQRNQAAGENHIPAPPGSPGKEPAFPARCRFGPWTSSRWGSHWKAEKPNSTHWCRTITHTHRVRVLPDRRRLAVSCRWWWSWRDPDPGCSGLWCNSLGRRRSARGTVGAWRTQRGNHQRLKRDITVSGLVSPTWPTAFLDPGCSAACRHRLS